MLYYKYNCKAIIEIFCDREFVKGDPIMKIEKKRNISYLLTLVLAFSLLCVPTLTANASSTSWSGSFYNEDRTPTQYYNAGTIYVTLNSSNSSENGNYNVHLINANNQIVSTLPAPMNGITTCNFVNQPAGNYYFKFTKSSWASQQVYSVLSRGSR